MSLWPWRGPPLRQIAAGGVALTLMIMGVSLAQRALWLDSQSYRAFAHSTQVSGLVIEIQRLATELRAWQAAVLLDVITHPADEPIADHIDLARLRASVERIESYINALELVAPPGAEVAQLRTTLRELDAASAKGFEELARSHRARPAASARLMELNAPLFDELDRGLATLVESLTAETRDLLVDTQARNANAQAALLGMSGAALVLALVSALMALRTRRHNTQLMQQLETLVEQDALTGIVNRRGLDRRLPHELGRAAREGQPLALVMIDLDHFKRFNDLRGHAAGDSLLRELAAAWQPELRAGDLFARYGGEEFTLALPQTDAAEAAALIERLRGRVPAGQTFSAGVAVWDREESAAALLARADAALLTAKRAGRRCTVFATAD